MLRSGLGACAIFLALCGAPIAAQDSSWQLKVPHSSTNGVMTYDAARGEVVFLGNGGDTKVWNGIQWTRKYPSNSPGPGWGRCIVYDAARAEVVVFGGYGVETSNPETWIWNGTDWTPRITSLDGSGSRNDCAMAYDAVRQEVVMFGGAGVFSSSLNDTWVWNGVDWAYKNSAHRPPGRFSHSMAFDTARGKLVLYGGRTSWSSCGDTWVWDGSDWAEMSTPIAPEPRPGHSMAYDAARGQVILFGGATASSIFGDTWAWDGSRWARLSPLSSPSPRQSHAVAYDALRQQVVIAGGYGNGLANDTWVWDGADWAAKGPLTPWSPPESHSASVAYDASRTQIVFFGGVDDASMTRNDTWTWDGTQWTLRNPATRPSPFQHGAMAFDSSRGEIVLFNGGETWTWNGTDWQQKFPPTSPIVYWGYRYYQMASDAASGQLVLFGGIRWTQDSAFGVNETWLWDGTTWRLANPQNSPDARMGHAMAYDAARGQVVLFGGQDGWGTYRENDTWIWDGANWTRISTPNGPVARQMHTMAYDAVRRQVILFGGTTSAGVLNDTWGWNGASWVQLQPANSPPARSEHVMAYDAARRQMVVFGGGYSYSRNDTWVWPGDAGATQPVISNLSPTSGPPGTVVTIAGNGFDAVQGTSTVGFDSLSGLVQAWSNTEIRAVVPFVVSLNRSYQLTVTTAGGTSNGMPFLVTASDSLKGKGTLNGTSTPVGASFQVIGPDQTFYTGTTPFTVKNTPAGSYTIVWGNLEGAISTPPQQTKVLEASQTLTFVGNYVISGGVQPGRPVPKWGDLSGCEPTDSYISRNFQCGSNEHLGVDYRTNGVTGYPILNVGAQGVIYRSLPTVAGFGSYDSNGSGAGPLVWVKYTLVSGDPIYLLYGHIADSWVDNSTGVETNKFKFGCTYTISWVEGTTVAPNALIGSTAPFYNGGRLTPHLHLGVFKPSKTCKNSFCEPPSRPLGYGPAVVREGEWINPEEFFENPVYKLTP